ncbi:MAG: hypothetical protein IJY97_05135 [Clostridia bacterium]|nr:hypothetical protein [Clostridia bacterium]
MKNKLFFLLIMLLVTAAIISCAEPEDLKIEVTEETAAEVNLIPNTDISVFSDFLDREGFVKGMSQGQLLDLAEKYAEGLDPSIVPVYCHYDGEYGGGCRASGELFGYTNDYHSKDGKVRYANSLYTAVEIKGLALPGGITFDDSVGDALEKLGIDRNICQKTAIDNATTLPLYNENGVSLVFTNWAMTQLPVETLYHYVITYSEKVGTVTRTVTLSFLDGHNKLGLVEISVVDEYER